METSLEAPTAAAEGDSSAIIALDYRLGGTAERPTKSFASINAAGVARLGSGETTTNLLTGESNTEIAVSKLPPLPGGTKVRSVLVTEKADQVYVAGADGTLFRYDTQKL